ncbi:MAG: GTPase ObgE [Ruminococcaceae bacterium]|nr:GTPase ObgE [Oscillospiraceae bacterium]
MFIDSANIVLKAGDGGNGAVSFHREKYVAAGGPDGGDGGRGGDIILRTDTNLSTLMDYKYRRKYTAGNGENGGKKKCFGRDGKSLVLRVPDGTVVKDRETGLVICDLSGENNEFVIAKGGRGGWGNSHFATPTRQCPRFAHSGTQGEVRDVTLELKLLADVGLLGFPNVGKSTLLSVVSAARPKIANYHFTTLVPNLGIVSVDDTSFVMADIPGLIEGAADGAGLGIDFLRHVERCRLLIHIVDVSGSEDRDPVEDFERINSELFLYSEDLASRPQIVAANKCDLAQDDTNLQRLIAHCESYGYPVFSMSAAMAEGTRELMNRTAEELSKLPPIKVFEAEYVPPEKTVSDDLVITREEGVYVVSGKKLMDSIAMVDPDDYESLAYMQRVLRDMGVFDRLEQMGVQEGDTVSINNFEFEYVR